MGLPRGACPGMIAQKHCAIPASMLNAAHHPIGVTCPAAVHLHLHGQFLQGDVAARVVRVFYQNALAARAHSGAAGRGHLARHLPAQRLQLGRAGASWPQAAAPLTPSMSQEKKRSMQAPLLPHARAAGIKIAPTGHCAAHTPQPVHFSSSMRATLFTTVTAPAGQFWHTSCSRCTRPYRPCG